MPVTDKDIIEFILEREGGYVNDPADPGGETNFGISKRAYPNVDIKNLTREGAIAIYQRDYLNKTGTTDPDMRACIADFGVNAGMSRAKVMAATADNVYKYLLFRLFYYTEISQKNVSLRKFTFGWYRRVYELYGLLMRG